MVSFLYYGMGMNSNPWIWCSKGPKCFFCVNCTSKTITLLKNLYPSSSRRKEIDLLCKGFTIGFFGFLFFPLSIPRRCNKEISFLLFSINTRSTTSNKNPSPQLQHFGMLFSETVVVLESGYWNFLQKCKRLGLPFIFFVDPNSFEKGKKTDRSLPSRVPASHQFSGV